jgi:hypothetical protein
MQGFIHLLLEAYVSETSGPQHLREIRQQAGLQGPPLATDYYPDQLTSRLIQAIADQQQTTPDDVLYHFGAYFINAPLMERNYRVFFEGHASARQFLERTPAIHHMLGTSLKSTALPDLRFVNHSPELLEIVYDSPRHLCRFLVGIIEGVGFRFNEALEVREMECQRRGAPACRVLVHFLPLRPAGPMRDHPSFAAAPGSGPQSSSGALPHHPAAPAETPATLERSAVPEATRKREEETDILILQALTAGQPPHVRLPTIGGASVPQQPLSLALSLFDIAHLLAISGAPAEHARLSVVQRALTRLALQGFVESKLDPHAVQPGISADAVALGGQGILAATRYRITPTGQAWLREMQQRRQGR